jgi:hypothetical protein
MTAFDAAYDGYMGSFNPRMFDGQVVAIPTKTCGPCGKVYDVAGWKELESLGEIEVEDGVFLEMRNCPCHATLTWLERREK